MADDNAIAGGGISEEAGAEGYSALLDQISKMKEERDLTKQSGDPNQLMLQEKQVNDSEYSGLTSLARYGLRDASSHIFGTEHPDASEDQYQSAIDAQRMADTKGAYAPRAMANDNQFRALARNLYEGATIARAPNENERQVAAAELQHQDSLAQIQQLENAPYYAFGSLFKNADNQKNAIAQLKLNANIIRDRDVERFHDPEVDQQRNDDDRLAALKMHASGDIVAARRMDLDNQLTADMRAVGSDDPRNAQLQNIRSQALANFDADAARQGKFQESQTNEHILAMQEEAKDAELRGEGRDNDAKISALKFASDQRVRNLQEQADAEADPTKKPQLLREAKAASDAGTIEQNALQKELARATQMSNVQAPALAGATQQAGNSSGGRESAGNLSDVSRKLDDAAGKMEKAFANGKTVVILKD